MRTRRRRCTTTTRRAPAPPPAEHRSFGGADGTPRRRRAGLGADGPAGHPDPLPSSQSDTPEFRPAAHERGLQAIDETLHAAAHRGFRQTATQGSEVVNEVFDLRGPWDSAGDRRVRHDVLEEE